MQTKKIVDISITLYQCGIVIDGVIEMFIGEERMRLKSNQSYFIPSGVKHGWKTFSEAAKILDVSFK